MLAIPLNALDMLINWLLVNPLLPVFLPEELLPLLLPLPPLLLLPLPPVPVIALFCRASSSALAFCRPAMVL